MRLAELIIKLPVPLAKDFEQFSRLAGYKNSSEMLAMFVKRELAIYYDTDINDERLTTIQ